MPAPSSVRSTRYYHGTGTHESAHSILRSGVLRPQSPRRGHTAPVAGRVYVTPNITQALAYATWDRSTGAKEMRKAEPYGYVFEVSPWFFGDVQPDEDVVGMLVRTAISDCDYENEHPAQGKLCRDPKLRQQLAASARRHLTQRQLEKIEQGEYAYYASGGKRLLRKLSATTQEQLLELGVALAVDGPVPITRAWRFPKPPKDTRAWVREIDNEQQFFERAEEIPMETKRSLLGALNPGPVRHGACVVIVREGLVLAISDGHDTSNWNLPGGGVEPGESFEQAAVRELFEETQVDARRAKLVPIQHRAGPRGESVAFLAVGDVVFPRGPMVSRPFEGHVQWKRPTELLRPSCTHAQTNLVTFGRIRLV